MCLLTDRRNTSGEDATELCMKQIKDRQAKATGRAVKCSEDLLKDRIYGHVGYNNMSITAEFCFQWTWSMKQCVTGALCDHSLSLLKAKFHYASWFEPASSQIAY